MSILNEVDDALTDKIEELEGELEEANSTIASLTERLNEAADMLARTYRIDNTPHAKRQWIEKGTLRVKAIVM